MCKDIPWVTEHCATCHRLQDEADEARMPVLHLFLVKFEAQMIATCCIAHSLLNPDSAFQQLCEG